MAGTIVALLRPMLIVCLLICMLLFSNTGGAGDQAQEVTGLSKAWDALAAKKPYDAISLLGRHLSLPDELFSYHYAYAMAYQQANEPIKAITHLRLAFIYASNWKDRETALLERAQYFLSLKNYDEAVLTYKVFLRTFKESPSRDGAVLGLANALYKLRRFNEANAYYARAGSSYPALYGSANALQVMGRVREAHELYLSLIDRDRSFLRASPETTYNIGENFRLMGKLPEAKLFLSTVTDLPQRSWADLSFGRIALEENRLDVAQKFFNSASKSSDRRLRPQALLGLADTYTKLNRIGDARAKLLEIRDQYPFGKVSDIAVVKLARIYRDEGKMKESLSLLRGLVYRGIPEKTALDEFEAMLIAEKDRDHEAFVGLWQSIGKWLLEPDRCEALLRIGDGLRSEGKIYLNLYTWILTNGTFRAKNAARIALASFFAEMGENEIAGRYLKSITDKGHENDIRRVQARLHLNQREYGRAFAALKGITSLRAADAELLVPVIGHMEPDKGGIAFSDKVLTKLAGSPQLYIAHADLLYRAGRRSEAADSYQRALKLLDSKKEVSSGDRTWALFRLSQLSSREGALEAVQGLQKGPAPYSQLAKALLLDVELTERTGTAH